MKDGYRCVCLDTSAFIRLHKGAGRDGGRNERPDELRGAENIQRAFDIWHRKSMPIIIPVPVLSEYLQVFPDRTEIEKQMDLVKTGFRIESIDAVTAIEAACLRSQILPPSQKAEIESEIGRRAKRIPVDCMILAVAKRRAAMLVTADKAMLSHAKRAGIMCSSLDELPIPGEQLKFIPTDDEPEEE